MLADELALELEDGGATVLGPVPNVAGALSLLEKETSLDGALSTSTSDANRRFRLRTRCSVAACR